MNPDPNGYDENDPSKEFLEVQQLVTLGLQGTPRTLKSKSDQSKWHDVLILPVDGLPFDHTYTNSEHIRGTQTSST